MDAAPSPTGHVLAPHHLVLLSILMIAWKELEIKKLPTAFATHLHRVLLNEVAEVTQPKPHRELLQIICNGPMADTPECAQFISALKMIHSDIYSTEKLGNFLGNAPALFIEKVMEDSPRFMRRSIFGYFCRRCFVSYVKLSYGGLNKLREDYQAWCAGSPVSRPFVLPKADLTIDYQLYRTQSDKKIWSGARAYEAFDLGKAIGNENKAIENIRSFFDQHFNDTTDSKGYRQHALLNVIHIHYMNKEYVAARKLLGEAITVARTANDRTTLLHCLSLLNRLPPSPGSKPSINEVQPDLDPLEVFYDVKKLIDEDNEQPLSAAFNKIIQAMGLYDHRLDSPRDRNSSVPNEVYQWAQHTVQSVVWQEAGCQKLAEISENVVIAFTDVGSEDSNRLTVLLNRAYRVARQGRYNEALSILLEPSAWRGITMANYNLWSHEIWSILALRAVRRGQERLYREYLLPRRPAGNWSPRYYQFEQPLSASLPSIRQSIYQVLQLKQHDQLSSSVNDLLKLLWQSEFLGRYHAYRTGIILMADFGLEYDMPKKSRRILEEIMPQVIVGDDKEQRAVGCFTYARCLLAGDDQSPEVLQEAREYLKKAEEDFTELQIYRSLKEVLYLQAVLSENLGLAAERDALIKRYEEVDETAREISTVVVDAEVHEIYSVMVLVGSGLAGR